MKVCHLFEKKSGQIHEVDLTRALEAVKEGQDFVWINLFEPPAEELEALSQALDVHELTIEDLRNSKVRPKVEEFENHLFVVFKALNLNEGEDPLDVINLNLLLFRNVLVSAHLKPVPAIKDLAQELEKRPAQMLKGPSFLLYRLLDLVVDEYFPILDELDEAADDMQTRLFEKFDPHVSSHIFDWKTKLAHLRRRVEAQREILMNLSNRPQALIPPKVQVYLRDVYDHIVRIHDTLESHRDILQGAMDSYMTQVSYRMNEVMKVLSAVATVMLPLSLLAGVFGTNFEVLPGSRNPHGFWIFVGVMVVIAVGNVVYFKRKKWF